MTGDVLLWLVATWMSLTIVMTAFRLLFGVASAPFWHLLRTSAAAALLLVVVLVVAVATVNYAPVVLVELTMFLLLTFFVMVVGAEVRYWLGRRKAAAAPKVAPAQAQPRMAVPTPIRRAGDRP